MPALSDPTVVPDAAGALTPEPGGEEFANGNASALADALETPDGDATGVVEVEELAEAERGEVELPPKAPPIGRPRRPIPPIALRKRLVRGRYRSAGIGWQLELRVDVGGSRPLNRVSG